MKECRMEKSLQYCGCVPPFYASKKMLEYCTLDDFDCLVKYKFNITDMNICNHCELACANTIYEVEKFDTMYRSQFKFEYFVRLNLYFKNGIRSE